MTYTDEQIARVVHEAARAMQDVHGDNAPSLPWASEDPGLRALTLRGVLLARTAAFTPELLHDAWCAGKAAQGWVYGPVKDPVARTHPCLLPYALLPACQQRKDVLFAAIVRALAEG